MQNRIGLSSFIFAYAIGCLVTLLNACVSIPKPPSKEQNFSPKTKLEKIGNSFQGEQNKPETYQNLYIHVIKNKSNQGLLASRLKQKIEFAFNLDGRLQVIKDKKQANIWFYGKVSHYQKIPLRFDQFNRATTYRLGILFEVKVILNPKFKKTNTQSTEQSTLLISKEVRFDTNHSPLESPFETEILANERLTDGLTDRIVYVSIEGWYSQLKREDELNKEKDSNLVNPRKNSEAKVERTPQIVEP